MREQNVEDDYDYVLLQVLCIENESKTDMCRMVFEQPARQLRTISIDCT